MAGHMRTPMVLDAIEMPCHTGVTMMKIYVVTATRPSSSAARPARVLEKTIEEVELATHGWLRWQNARRLRATSTTSHPPSSTSTSTLPTRSTKPWPHDKTPEFHQTQDAVCVASRLGPSFGKHVHEYPREHGGVATAEPEH
jgi:hypothetical protein